MPCHDSKKEDIPMEDVGLALREMRSEINDLMERL